MIVLLMSILFFILAGSGSSAQQIPLKRIEQIPRIPVNYEMRDWKKVARQYDSLIFNTSILGDYLPVIHVDPSGINYPSHQSIRLYTYIGTNYPSSSEAINVIPAVISGTLVGIDKRDQFGHNWVLMCEDFFNLKNGQKVYLNSPSTITGNDWWYETMPNVFFYQLYNFYPDEGDFQDQFTIVADRWYEALVKMGGVVSPWKVPYMNYRAFNLLTMQPNNSGVKEPEAAGAIAWLLYNAYIKTGVEKYRIGAQWAMEFLSGWQSNPSYEIQLPYGAYTAARMNAELGTNYDIEKLLNWCFDIGPLRSWGMITGKWGAYGVNGLIGEVNSNNDYAFLMNTFQQASALVPLVRYDDRFARAIAKWLLHAASAARLFYSRYLSDVNQDNENWIKQYDLNGVIAYEALRQSQNANSPYATGDAMAGKWSRTNLSLYTSSHVGVFGALIDTTNTKMILKIDLLKTDYFGNTSFPSFMYYNPFDTVKDIRISLPEGTFDLYDAVTNKLILRSAQNSALFPLQADSAAIIVVLPPDANIIYKAGKMIVNGIIADYNTAGSSVNVGNDNSLKVPEKFRLEQNFPNPFNSSTQLYFSLDQDGDISLTVYDPLGKMVMEVFRGFMKAGEHTMSIAPEFLSSGMYYCALQSGDRVLVRKMILMK